MSTSPAAAQTAVVTIGFGIGVLAVIDAGRTGHTPTARRILGTAVGTFGLSALAMGAPVVARNLALLWGVSTLIVSGGPALASVATATRAPSPSTTQRNAPV